MARFNPKNIEKKWQARWLKEKVYEPSFVKASTGAKAMADKSKGKPDFRRAKRPFYNLMMFPYPSAEGLHVGGVRTFTGVDIFGRYKRMQGYDVFEPIGLDGFGIHSENYAIKAGKHPADLSKITEKNFYRQLGAMGNGFAWEERVETYDPEYYRWTQWIFIRMFKKGLAYRKKAVVNWCPSCKTVLADEQVIQKSEIRNPKSETNPKSQISNSKHEISIGVCERCETPVIKRELEQWFFKITDYAERLLNNLETIDWSEHIKIAQRNWIGKSEGALIKFQISNLKFQTNFKSQIQNSKQDIEIFTTRPDTLFGATFLVISPELAKKWIVQGWQASENVRRYIAESLSKKDEERGAEGKEKTGVDTGAKATNPASGEDIPVWIADYVLGGVGTGAIMAVPAHDRRDWDFAKKFDLPVKMVVCPHYPAPTCPVLDSAYEGAGHLVDSGKFNGMPSEKAKWEIVKSVGGIRKINYRLRDWLISRQRYWGPPIPMIHCDRCEGAGRGLRKDMPGWYPVADNDLPVKLPYIKDFRPTGEGVSPLANVPRFYKVRCPQCKAPARRETDVSDTFLDSSWYYLRYPSAKDKKHAWDPAITKKWLPVDMYIGGAEHAVLHLLYVRFLTMVFKDLKLIGFEEPFKRFRTHGLITKDGAKMSKSKGNVVNPDEYMNAFGADAMRMYLAFLAPLDQGGDFRDEGIKGITRFLERVWRFVIVQPSKNPKSKIQNPKQISNNKIQKILHQTIKKVGEDIEHLQYNTAISALMILLNEFEEKPEIVNQSDIAIFLKLLAPFAPHITEELWQQYVATSYKLQAASFHSIHREAWPTYDARKIQEATMQIVLQINGKVRDRMEMPANASEREVVREARMREKVKSFLGGREPRKVIFVPGKLVNFVL